MYTKSYLFLILLSLIFISTFSKTIDSVEIKIKAPLYKEDEVKLSYASALNSQKISLKLDVFGNGRTKVPVDEKTFWRLSMGNYSTLILLDKKYDLTIYFEKENKPVFWGNGANVNNYLTEDLLLGDKFDTKAYAMDGTIENIEPFLKLVNIYQRKFDTLYKKYYPTSVADKELEYILSAINQSYILHQKQTFLNLFEMDVANELKLEQKLELDKNNLLGDTILVKIGNFSLLGNFGSYLAKYGYYYLMKTSGSYKPDKETVNEVYLKAFKAIESNPFYSTPIKKMQLFKELYIDFQTFPFSSVLDSVFKSMQNTYPHDPYVEVLESVRQQKNHLKKGNSAPALQGTDPLGKTIALSDFKGKVVFIDSWSTTCGGCIKSLPHVFELQKHFKNNPDVKFIYLSKDRDKEKWLRYLNNHPQFEGVHLLLQDKYEDAWIGLGTPQYIIIDKEGKIVNAFAEIIAARKEMEEALNN